MDPAGGDCVIPRDQQIKIFGQRFSNIFCQLNDTCRHFFEFISGQVFKNERDWRSALLCFKTSVLESAVGSRTERQEVYRQVESFLLDPTNQNVVVSKSRTKCVATRTSLIRLLTDVSTSRPSATCVVCKISGGIIVQCSGRRCTNTFHTFCAAATTYCKNPASRYYRCRSCVAPDAAFAVSTTKKKRSRIKASTKSRRKKNELDEEVLATVSVPGAHASDASDDEEQHQQEEQNEEDDGDGKDDGSGKDAEDGASLNASRPACSFYDSSFVTAATGVASEANVSRNAFFPAAFDTTPVFMTPSTNALASPNAASPLLNLKSQFFCLSQDVSSLHEEMVSLRGSVQAISQENEAALRAILTRVRLELNHLQSVLRETLRSGYAQETSLLPASDVEESFVVPFGQISANFYDSDDNMTSGDEVPVSGGDNVDVGGGGIDASAARDLGRPAAFPPKQPQGDNEVVANFGRQSIHSPDTDASSTAAAEASGLATSANALDESCSIVVKKSFWTVTKQMSLAKYLNTRFECNFEEHVHVNGKLCDVSHVCQEGIPEAKVHHFVSPSLVVKAYMNVLGSVKHLAQGLHEAAATAFVCDKKGWKYEVFGVRTEGTHAVYAHICLLRTLLDSQSLTADEATNAFIELLDTTGVAHGDTHPDNVKASASGGFEILDFERSFLMEKNVQPEMASSIRIYAHEPQRRPELLSNMQSQGLDATRNRFIQLAKHCLLSGGDIFSLGINDFLNVFQRKK